MDLRKQFLTAVLPPLNDGEQYCSWGIRKDDGKERRKQRFAGSLDDLIAQCDTLNEAGFNSFFALAKFVSKDQGRYAANACGLKSFFLDIDCGPKKPYADLPSGLLALRDFCKATGLPRPTIVQSGRGAHVYWALKEALPPGEWKPHAEKLKELCAEFRLDIDTSVPADAARVLRMPGTQHLKDPDNPLPVQILYSAPEIDNATLLALLPPDVDPLAGFVAPEGVKQYDPLTQALIGASASVFKNIYVKSMQGTGCAQIAHIVEEQATLEEPLWRAGLSIAHHCTDRSKAIHFISKKHPDYDAERTERKAEETKGPYTCETFRKLRPAGCAGCTHKITSPIQLGREIVEATPEESVVVAVESATQAPKTYDIPKYPFPFFRGKAGGVFVRLKDKDDGETEEVLYPYDFYVVKRMIDPDIGETLLLRLHLPKDGVRDFIMPLASVLSKEKFVSIVAGYGIAVLGKKQDLLMQYVAKSVEALQQQTQAEKSHKQYGWLDDNSAIVVGDREIRLAETVYTPPSVPTLPTVHMFRPKGDFHIWRDVINAYGREGMEFRAFAFFMGFGTLLMKFTPLDGFLLNLVSQKSGTGKTTILHAINSIYGSPKELLLNPVDTVNSRMQRVGVMRNLTVTMDEITNMHPDQLSEQVYGVTMGRAKNRLRQHDNAERINHTKWSTGMVTSSNRSVIDALLSIKGFPDGEIKRILEVPVAKDPNDDPVWSRAHFGRLLDNYGHALEPYARTLITQLPMVQEVLTQTQERVDRAAETRNTERYWALMVSLALAGGAIAKNIGLHNIEMRPIFDYAINAIRDARATAREIMFDSEDRLGLFLNQRNFEILIINNQREARTGLEQAPIREPRGALTIRYEPDTKQLFIVAKAFRDDCAKQSVNYEEMLKPYRKSGALLGVRKKRMTSGTVANTQAAVSALCFDVTKLEDFNEQVLFYNADAGVPNPD